MRCTGSRVSYYAETPLYDSCAFQRIHCTAHNESQRTVCECEVQAPAYNKQEHVLDCRNKHLYYWALLNGCSIGLYGKFSPHIEIWQLYMFAPCHSVS